MNIINLIKKYRTFFSLVWFVLFWVFLFNQYSPQEIVSYIWLENAYLVVFLVWAFWWISTLTVTHFYTTIITLTIWWANPFLIWIFAWTWASIWDSIFYYLWKKWKKLTTSFQNKIKPISDWIQKQPKKLIQFFIFLYAWFIPFPKDFLMLALAFSWFSYKKIIIPLLIWNIINLSILAYISWKFL